MKRRLLAVFVLAMAFVLLFPTASHASEAADVLWNEYLEVLPGADDSLSPEEQLSGVGVDALIGEIVSGLSDGLSSAVSFFALVMGLSALMSVGEAAFLGETSDRRGVSAVISVIATATVFFHMRGAILAVKNGLSELSVLLTGLVPVLSGVLAAGGCAESAAVQAMNMNITLGIISFAESKLLMPMVSSLFCLCAVSGLDGGGVSKIAKSLKGFFTFASGLITAVLAAALSMQSLITRTKDSAALAAARYAASGMIPMVGATVSSALATLGGGLSVVRSAVGIGSIMAITGIVLSPLIMLLLYKLSLAVAVSVLEGISSTSGGVRAFSALKGALDALIAVYSMAATVSVLEVIVFLKCGVDAFG